MNDICLSVIIPSYLEEENLRLILPRLKKILAQLSVKSEILVIDTMQTMDNTRNVCEEYEVNYFNREKGNYYGHAVRTGIKNAKGDFLIFMDADGSHSPEFIPQLFNTPCPALCRY